MAQLALSFFFLLLFIRFSLRLFLFFSPHLSLPNRCRRLPGQTAPLCLLFAQALAFSVSLRLSLSVSHSRLSLFSRPLSLHSSFPFGQAWGAAPPLWCAVHCCLPFLPLRSRPTPPSRVASSMWTASHTLSWAPISAQRTAQTLSTSQQGRRAVGVTSGTVAGARDKRNKEELPRESRPAQRSRSLTGPFRQSNGGETESQERPSAFATARLGRGAGRTQGTHESGITSPNRNLLLASTDEPRSACRARETFQSLPHSCDKRSTRHGTRRSPSDPSIGLASTTPLPLPVASTRRSATAMSTATTPPSRPTSTTPPATTSKC